MAALFVNPHVFVDCVDGERFRGATRRLAGSSRRGTTLASSCGYHTTSHALFMGKKPKITCTRCKSTFKRTSGALSTVCNRCKTLPAAAGDALEGGDVDGVVLGFHSPGVQGVDVGDSEYESSRLSAALAGVAGGGAGKKKKKSKKRAPAVNAKSDPACLEILADLDKKTRLIDRDSGEEALKVCVETLRAAKVVAVDCEGVMMSRTGPVTVLQCATREVIFLIDVQSLGSSAFGARGSGCIRDVLESPDVLKLMFDCRMDSDALFHQFDVRLENVLDVQLLDVAARRALGKMIDRVPGIAKCTGTHLTGAETAVADDLKVRVKKLYSVEESTLWATRPFTDDVRRYAALDVWLLIRLHTKMVFDLRDDTDDWLARTFKASAKRVLEFRELDVAMSQGVFTEESTVAPAF